MVSKKITAENAKLTPRDTELITLAWNCVDNPQIDFAKFAELADYKNAATAKVCWNIIRKKLAFQVPSTAGTAAAGEASGTAAVAATAATAATTSGGASGDVATKLKTTGAGARGGRGGGRGTSRTTSSTPVYGANDDDEDEEDNEIEWYAAPAKKKQRNGKGGANPRPAASTSAAGGALFRGKGPATSKDKMPTPELEEDVESIKQEADSVEDDGIEQKKKKQAHVWNERDEQDYLRSFGGNLFDYHSDH